MYPPHRHHWTPPEQNPFLQMAAVLLGCLVAGGALFWLVSSLSAFLFLGHWPALSGQATAAAIGHFRPQDPRASWPAPLQGQLAGPVEFYTTLFLLLLAVVGGGVWIARNFQQRGYSRKQGRSSQGAPPARWATARQLRDLRVPAPAPGRLTLGRTSGLRAGFLAAEPLHSVLAIGPPGSGKTVSLAAPALLEWEGPALATAIKGDLLRATIHSRKRKGRVLVFDPAGLCGLQQAVWNPLRSCDRLAAARAQARRFVEVGTGTTQDQLQSSDANHWYTLAVGYLTVLLFAAARSHSSISEVARWVGANDTDTPTKALEAEAKTANDSDKKEIEDALAQLKGAHASDHRSFTALRGTVQEVLDPYFDPRVAESTTNENGWPEINPQEILGSKDTVYLIAPPKEQKDLGVLFAALAKELVDAIYDSELKSGGPLSPPFLLDLDDAATLAPLPDLNSIAVTGRGVGIQLVSIWHDAAQIARQYRSAGSLVNAHRARVFLTGIADVSTLDYASQLLGQEEVSRTSLAQGSEGKTQTTEAPHQQALAPAHAVRQTDKDHGLVVYGNLPPTLVSLRPYYKDKGLAALSRGESPTATGQNRFDLLDGWPKTF